jgi:hypothetical protein
MRSSLLASLALSVALIPSACFATPVDYLLQFTVDTIGGSTDPGNCSAGELNGAGGFNCSIAVGDTYFGSLRIDDTLLAADGQNLRALVLHLVIDIAGIAWDSLIPYPDSAFYGFRGPDGLGSDSPGFDVAGGELVDLRGGVYGLSDAPYVDFSPLGPDGGLHRFGAGDGRTWAYGDMLIARVPEAPAVPLPGALWLLGSAWAVLTLRTRRLRS